MTTRRCSKPRKSPIRIPKGLAKGPQTAELLRQVLIEAPKEWPVFSAIAYYLTRLEAEVILKSLLTGHKGPKSRSSRKGLAQKKQKR